jgi:2-succinyl-5-enolpyruvyl-6-hydroxy-3-cyclohexene-1-carboxylate synthase
LAARLTPDVILRFGPPVTGRPLSSYLQRYRRVRQVVITERGGYPDPDLTAAEYFPAEPTDVCDVLLAETDLTPADPEWLVEWQTANDLTTQVVDRVLAETDSLSEVSAITELAVAVPHAYSVFAGNSMPVRDIDSFWPSSSKALFFYGNRGASGIDGVVSTALGAAARCYGQLVLVIGDLSFYHDMNGLLAAKRFGISATVVLINNDGGGIFSFLPQHDDQEHFEALFGTPHGLDFAPVADLYGVGFQRVTTRQQYRDALAASFAAPGVQVIEIKTDRAENLKLHQRIWRDVADAVSPARTEALEGRAADVLVEEAAQ